METLPIKKWGNSNGLRIPKNILDFMGLHTDDKVLLTPEEHQGKRRLIIEAAEVPQEILIEELFADYSAEKLQVELQDLGEARGHEKW